MDAATYAAEARVEATHWWFVVRRELMGRLLRGMGLPPDAGVLDVGTSTGTNLRMLRDLGFTNVMGLDFSEEAVRFCADKGLGPVQQGDACAMPFEEGRFQLVLLTDLIEHVDDVAALAEAFRVTAPGGRVLITVPAFQQLWGLQDDVSHHLRRYTMGQMLTRVRAAGFTVQRSFYFNYLLFLPIWLARRVIRVFKVKLESENEVNSPLLNRVFTALFRLDVATAPWLRPPFGVSALVVAVKPG